MINWVKNFFKGSVNNSKLEVKEPINSEGAVEPKAITLIVAVWEDLPTEVTDDMGRKISVNSYKLTNPSLCSILRVNEEGGTPLVWLNNISDSNPITLLQLVRKRFKLPKDASMAVQFRVLSLAGRNLRHTFLTVAPTGSRMVVLEKELQAIANGI